MVMLMTKKVVREVKNHEKSTLNKDLKRTAKMEPGTGGENPRSGRVTRSVYDAIA
jgi:hypothetical protein